MKGSDFSAVPLCMRHHHRVHAEAVPVAWLTLMACEVIRCCVDAGDGGDALGPKAIRLALGRAVAEVVETVDELADDGR